MKVESSGHYEVPPFILLDESWYLCRVIKEIKWGDPLPNGKKSLQMPMQIAEGENDGLAQSIYFIPDSAAGIDAMNALIMGLGLAEAWESIPEDKKMTLSEVSVEYAAKVMPDRLIFAYIELNEDKKTGQWRNRVTATHPANDPGFARLIPEGRKKTLEARKAKEGNSEEKVGQEISQPSDRPAPTPFQQPPSQGNLF